MGTVWSSYKVLIYLLLTFHKGNKSWTASTLYNYIRYILWLLVTTEQYYPVSMMPGLCNVVDLKVAITLSLHHYTGLQANNVPSAITISVLVFLWLIFPSWASVSPCHAVSGPMKDCSFYLWFELSVLVCGCRKIFTLLSMPLSPAMATWNLPLICSRRKNFLFWGFWVWWGKWRYWRKCSMARVLNPNFEIILGFKMFKN